MTVGKEVLGNIPGWEAHNVLLCESKRLTRVEKYVPCEFCMKFCVGEQLWYIMFVENTVRHYFKIGLDDKNNDGPDQEKKDKSSHS
jgi:hypothetical protein